MRNCEDCKFGNYDCEFDEEIGEEYLIYTCRKSNDTNSEEECFDFEEQKNEKYKEIETKCDNCIKLEECIEKNEVINVTMSNSTKMHYIPNRNGCQK